MRSSIAALCPADQDSEGPASEVRLAARDLRDLTIGDDLCAALARLCDGALEAPCARKRIWSIAPVPRAGGFA
jgi:hypothetical protein